MSDEETIFRNFVARLRPHHEVFSARTLGWTFVRIVGRARVPDLDSDDWIEYVPVAR